MPNSILDQISNQLADVIAAAAPSVVQVIGRRQPASGVVYAPDTVITTTRAVGREDGLTIRTPEGQTADAEVVGWDPATHLVVLKVTGVSLSPASVARTPARVGHLAVGVARSWSNSVTASAGIVSVIGGPLPTGPGRRIEEIIRTNAPMHRGFAGGAFMNTAGELLGLTTAEEIRGLGVVIPASIAWNTATGLLEHGRARRGYLGVAGQAVRLASGQRSADGPATGVLIIRVLDDSPAEKAGLLVGDVLIAMEGQALDSPDRLLTGLSGRSGQTVTLEVLRGGVKTTASVALGES